MRRDRDYWQRLRRDRRSNWAAGFAGVAAIAATVSPIGLLVEGSQYEARGNPFYWALMLPVVWWLSGLGGFEPRAVRWWIEDGFRRRLIETDRIVRQIM